MQTVTADINMHWPTVSLDPYLSMSSSGKMVMVFNCGKMHMKVAQSCLVLCNPVDYTVRGILQARTLDWENAHKICHLNNSQVFKSVALSMFILLFTHTVVPFSISPPQSLHIH